MNRSGNKRWRHLEDYGSRDGPSTPQPPAAKRQKTNLVRSQSVSAPSRQPLPDGKKARSTSSLMSRIQKAEQIQACSRERMKNLKTDTKQKGLFRKKLSSIKKIFQENSARHPLTRRPLPGSEGVPGLDEGLRYLSTLYRPLLHLRFRAERGDWSYNNTRFSLQIPAHGDPAGGEFEALGRKLFALERKLRRPCLVSRGFDSRDPDLYHDTMHPEPPRLYVREEDVEGLLPEEGETGSFIITNITPFRCSDDDHRDYHVRFELLGVPDELPLREVTQVMMTNCF